MSKNDTQKGIMTKKDTHKKRNAKEGYMQKKE